MKDQIDSEQLEKEIRIYKENPKDLYGEWFFRKLKRCHNWQSWMGGQIKTVLNINSAVDIGCGLGYYLEGMNIPNVYGFEYMYDFAKPYLNDKGVSFVKYGNAMEKIECPVCDLSMSVECAEHILSEYSDVFVDNLTSLSRKYIFFTAAKPGQGGTGHINEQPMSFWLDKFSGRGFIINKEKEHELKVAFSKSNVATKYMNFRRTFVLLEKHG